MWRHALRPTPPEWKPAPAAAASRTSILQSTHSPVSGSAPHRSLPSESKEAQIWQNSGRPGSHVVQCSPLRARRQARQAASAGWSLAA